MRPGVITRNVTPPPSTSRSEELTQTRHRGFGTGQLYSPPRQDKPLEMIPKSMILNVKPPRRDPR